MTTISLKVLRVVSGQMILSLLAVLIYDIIFYCADILVTLSLVFIFICLSSCSIDSTISFIFDINSFFSFFIYLSS